VPGKALPDDDPPEDDRAPGDAGPEGVPETVAPELGCIAEEPEVVEPEPVAAGRSVDPDGAGACATAGAASAAAARQAAMQVLNIGLSATESRQAGEARRQRGRNRLRSGLRRSAPRARSASEA
jgi:hypothetical protein